jgi:hypothetical protein
MFSPKRIFSLVLCFALLFAVGCSNTTSSSDDVPGFGPKVDAATFAGTWTSTGGDGFIVNTMTFAYEPEGYGFSGNIVGAVAADPSLLQSEYGYLTIQITADTGWGKEIGKYYVIHWKDLTSSSVQESSATSTDYTDPINNGMSTLEEAVTEYTVDNGYFGYYGTYTK